MPDVASGLEIDGAPASGADLSDAEFNAAVAAQAGRQSDDAAVSEPHDASLDSADDIRRAVLSNEQSTDIRDGLTVASEPEPPQDATKSALVDAVSKLTTALGTRTSNEREQADQLAFREFVEKYDNEELSYGDMLRELHTLAPEYRDAALDRIASYESGVFFDQDDDDFSEFDVETYDATITKLRTDVEEFADAHSRLIESEHKVKALERERELEAQAIVGHYRTLGVQPANGYVADRDFLRSQGIDLNQVRGDKLIHMLQTTAAARKVEESAVRQDAFRASFAEASDTSVGAGLEVLGAFGYMPVQPRPTGVKKHTVEENRELIERTRDEMFSPRSGRRLTRAQRHELGRAQIMAAEISKWEDGLTTADGRATSLDVVTGAKERHERDQRDALARTQGLLRR